MAEWTETLEPYIKVQEEVKTVTINPTTGEDLIIGCVIFADAGPSVPTLIAGQKDFRETYSSQDLTEDYINSLSSLYDGEDSSLPATMWTNAYRLAGSNTLLVVRAGKANGLNFALPLDGSNKGVYILKDGVLMQKIPAFKIVVDKNGDLANTNSDGWSINISGIGIVGNRVSDSGPMYDILANNLVELVDVLNDSPALFSPDYSFFADVDAVKGTELKTNFEDAVSVVFNEVYIAKDIIDYSEDGKRTVKDGCSYLTVCAPDYREPSQPVLLLNDQFVGEEPSYYAVNNYNSASDLRLRIRRFNHDAVVSNNIKAQSELTIAGPSMYTPISSVLDTFTGAVKRDNTSVSTKEPSESVLKRDFFEVAIYDPSLSGEVLFFNVGNIPGRGDITVDELNNQMKMIGFNLPKDLHELNINYSLYSADANLLTNETELNENGVDQIFCDLSIDPKKYSILKASDTDLLKAIDLIEEDEVYVTEGLSDLGNTDASFQSYLANLAINKNYFYPISTVNSTNYMTIGNSISKISQNSYKLYTSAPWDLDSSTLGWENYISPSVIYWEAVARNRRNNEEFRGVLGQNGGLVQYQSPVVEFNKKTRQLLLTKKVNTATWDIQTSSYNMNDNYTKQTENTILSDDGNSRLHIRISKACPVLLKQFIGRKITDRLCKDIYDALSYYFRTVIIPYGYTVDDYQIFCDYDEELARQNKVKVVINVRYSRSLKYINVINRAFDVGMDISSAE